MATKSSMSGPSADAAASIILDAGGVGSGQPEAVRHQLSKKATVGTSGSAASASATESTTTASKRTCVCVLILLFLLDGFVVTVYRAA
jgi:hypothetical protein